MAATSSDFDLGVPMTPMRSNSRLQRPMMMTTDDTDVEPMTATVRMKDRSLALKKPMFFDTQGFDRRRPEPTAENSPNQDTHPDMPFGFEEVAASPDVPTGECDELFIADSAAVSAGATPTTAAKQGFPSSGGVETGAKGPTLRPRAGRKGPSNCGLSMSHVLSDAPHLWLTHQVAGSAVRVRMFANVEQFEEFCSHSSLEMPKYVLSLKKQHYSKLHHIANDSDNDEGGESVPDGWRGSDKQRSNASVSDKSLGSSKRSKTSTASSTSSSSSRLSVELISDALMHDRIHECRWIDFQYNNSTELQRFLGLLCLAETTVESIMDEDLTDQAVLYPSFGYVYVNVTCKPVQRDAGDGDDAFAGQRSLRRANQSFASTASAASTVAYDDGQAGAVSVSCIVYPDWIFTIHAKPLEELGDLVKQVHLDFTLRGRWTQTHQSPPTPGMDVGSVILKRMMRPAWVLSTLVDFSVANALPDPTRLLQLLDQIETQTMALGSQIGNYSQKALSSKLSAVRKSISRHREVVASKEQLLEQLLQPVMRTTFIARRPRDADIYIHCQSRVAKVSERLNSAREVLQVSNGAFAAAGQLRLARVSHALEIRMRFMTQITTVFAPPNCIAGLMGMNIVIPFLTTHGFNVVGAFWAIIAVVLGWLVIMLQPTMSLYFEARDVERELERFSDTRRTERKERQKRSKRHEA